MAHFPCSSYFDKVNLLFAFNKKCDLFLYWMHIDWSLIHLFILWIYKAMQLSPSFSWKPPQCPPSFSTSSITSEEDSVKCFFLKIETVNFYCRDNYILRLLITWYKYRAVHSVHSGSSYHKLNINPTHVFLFDKKKNKTIYTAYKNEIQYYQIFRI